MKVSTTREPVPVLLKRTAEHCGRMEVVSGRILEGLSQERNPAEWNHAYWLHGQLSAMTAALHHEADRRTKR